MVCCKMYRDVFSKGFAVLEKYVDSGNEQLIEQFDCTNRKIAALKKKVTELKSKIFTPSFKRRNYAREI